MPDIVTDLAAAAGRTGEHPVVPAQRAHRRHCGQVPVRTQHRLQLSTLVHPLYNLRVPEQLAVDEDERKGQVGVSFLQSGGNLSPVLP